ncbi:hypothetical protein KDL45_06640 [bacterium]|nr:hypothetical protein [bacterium]
MFMIKAEGTFQLAPALSARLAGLFTHDYEWNEDRDRGEAEPQLWEAYATYRVGKWDFNAGQKIWGWGKTDIISPTDLINPVDFQRFFDAEMGISKLPVISLAGTYYYNDYHAEAIYLPFHRPSRFDLVERDFAILGHRFPVTELLGLIDDSAGYRNLKRFLDRWVPEWEEDLADVLDDQEYFDNHTEDKDDNFTTGSGAVRLGGSKGGYDFDIMGYYLYDQMPTIHFNPELLALDDTANPNSGDYATIPDPRDLSTTLLTEPLRGVYHRVYGPGAAFGTSLGAFTVRAEGTAIFNRRTYRDDLTLVKKPVYTVAVNADYLFPGDVQVTATFLHSSIGDYESDLLTEPVYALLFVGYKADFFRGRLKTQGVVTYDFSYIDADQWGKGDISGQDGQFSTMVEWAFTDDLLSGVGTNLFWGETDRLFGYLRDNSRVFLTGTYNF